MILEAGESSDSKNALKVKLMPTSAGRLAAKIGGFFAIHQQLIKK
jgi:hypothetical protein